ncbi:MAG: disulfide isomerase DsbC N-terminal domain-containing protein, partial [Deferrisomatales bacterium]|nr:disulfide isomerase DsbC N-terminal domain-containing protein [Deferrisomatales bacterium]
MKCHQRIACCMLLLLLAAPPMAWASAEDDRAEAERALRQLFPNLKVAAVHPTPVTGLVEVVAGGNVLYFAPATGHLLFGELW